MTDPSNVKQFNDYVVLIENVLPRTVCRQLMCEAKGDETYEPILGLDNKRYQSGAECMHGHCNPEHRDRETSLLSL